MKETSREEAMKKWAPILSGMGLTGSKADWMSEYAEIHSKNEHWGGMQPSEESSEAVEDFPSMLPMAMKVAAQTIGTDLVAVAPIGGGNTPDELKEIREDVKIENRDRKIEAVVEGKEFEEMKVEDHPDYVKPAGPSGQLFYMDFKYGTQSDGSF
jgi:hypothetical protein